MTTINEPPATATFDIANKHWELCDYHSHKGGSCRTVAAPESLTAMAQLATTALSLAKQITE